MSQLGASDEPSFTYKFTFLTPQSYVRPDSGIDHSDPNVEEFVRHFLGRAQRDFQMRCYLANQTSEAYIEGFDAFEERFLRHSEYSVILVSPNSSRCLQLFYPRLFVFLQSRPEWSNRFLLVYLGPVVMKKPFDLEVFALDPIEFPLENWRSCEEAWSRMFNLLKMEWIPYDGASRRTSLIQNTVTQALIQNETASANVTGLELVKEDIVPLNEEVTQILEQEQSSQEDTSHATNDTISVAMEDSKVDSIATQKSAETLSNPNEHAEQKRVVHDDLSTNAIPMELDEVTLYHDIVHQVDHKCHSKNTGTVAEMLTYKNRFINNSMSEACSWTEVLPSRELEIDLTTEIEGNEHLPLLEYEIVSPRVRSSISDNFGFELVGIDKEEVEEETEKIHSVHLEPTSTEAVVPDETISKYSESADCFESSEEPRPSSSDVQAELPAATIPPELPTIESPENMRWYSHFAVKPILTKDEICKPKDEEVTDPGILNTYVEMDSINHWVAPESVSVSKSSETLNATEALLEVYNKDVKKAYADSAITSLDVVVQAEETVETQPSQEMEEDGKEVEATPKVAVLESILDNDELEITFRIGSVTRTGRKIEDGALGKNSKALCEASEEVIQKIHENPEENTSTEDVQELTLETQPDAKVDQIEESGNIPDSHNLHEEPILVEKEESNSIVENQPSERIGESAKEVEAVSTPSKTEEMEAPSAPESFHLNDTADVVRDISTKHEIQNETSPLDLDVSPPIAIKCQLFSVADNQQQPTEDVKEMNQAEEGDAKNHLEFTPPKAIKCALFSEEAITSATSESVDNQQVHESLPDIQNLTAETTQIPEIVSPENSTKIESRPEIIKCQLFSQPLPSEDPELILETPLVVEQKSNTTVEDQLPEQTEENTKEVETVSLQLKTIEMESPSVPEPVNEIAVTLSQISETVIASASVDNQLVCENLPDVQPSNVKITQAPETSNVALENATTKTNQPEIIKCQLFSQTTEIHEENSILSDDLRSTEIHAATDNINVVEPTLDQVLPACVEVEAISSIAVEDAVSDESKGAHSVTANEDTSSEPITEVVQTTEENSIESTFTEIVQEMILVTKPDEASLIVEQESNVKAEDPLPERLGENTKEVETEKIEASPAPRSREDYEWEFHLRNGLVGLQTGEYKMTQNEEVAESGNEETSFPNSSEDILTENETPSLNLEVELPIATTCQLSSVESEEQQATEDVKEPKDTAISISQFEDADAESTSSIAIKCEFNSESVIALTTPESVDNQLVHENLEDVQNSSVEPLQIPEIVPETSDPSPEPSTQTESHPEIIKCQLFLEPVPSQDAGNPPATQVIHQESNSKSEDQVSEQIEETTKEVKMEDMGTPSDPEYVDDDDFECFLRTGMTRREFDKKLEAEIAEGANEETLPPISTESSELTEETSLVPDKSLVEKQEPEAHKDGAEYVDDDDFECFLRTGMTRREFDKKLEEEIAEGGNEETLLPISTESSELTEETSLVPDNSLVEKQEPEAHKDEADGAIFGKPRSEPPDGIAVDEVYIVETNSSTEENLPVENDQAVAPIREVQLGAFVERCLEEPLIHISEEQTSLPADEETGESSSESQMSIQLEENVSSISTLEVTSLVRVEGEEPTSSSAVVQIVNDERLASSIPVEHVESKVPIQVENVEVEISLATASEIVVDEASRVLQNVELVLLKEQTSIEEQAVVDSNAEAIEKSSLVPVDKPSMQSNIELDEHPENVDELVSINSSLVKLEKPICEPSSVECVSADLTTETVSEEVNITESNVDQGKDSATDVLATPLKQHTEPVCDHAEETVPIVNIPQESSVTLNIQEVPDVIVERSAEIVSQSETTEAEIKSQFSEETAASVSQVPGAPPLELSNPEIMIQTFKNRELTVHLSTDGTCHHFSPAQEDTIDLTISETKETVSVEEIQTHIGESANEMDLKETPKKVDPDIAETTKAEITVDKDSLVFETSDMVVEAVKGSTTKTAITKPTGSAPAAERASITNTGTPCLILTPSVYSPAHEDSSKKNKRTNQLTKTFLRDLERCMGSANFQEKCTIPTNEGEAFFEDLKEFQEHFLKDESALIILVEKDLAHAFEVFFARIFVFLSFFPEWSSKILVIFLNDLEVSPRYNLDVLPQQPIKYFLPESQGVQRVMEFLTDNK